MGRTWNDLPAEIVRMIFGKLVSKDTTKPINEWGEEVLRTGLIARRVCWVWHGVLTELLLKNIDLDFILDLGPDPLCLEALKMVYEERKRLISGPEVTASEDVARANLAVVFEGYLRTVIKKEKLSCIDFILQTFPDYGDIWDIKTDLLNVAIGASSPTSVSRLLKYEWIRRANSSVMGLDTPLARAIAAEQYTIAEMLLKHRASRKIRITHRRVQPSTMTVTIVSYAVLKDDKKMLEFLLDNGFDPNDMIESKKRVGEGTPLVRALVERNVEMAKLLINRGAKVSGFPPHLHWFPLEAAIMECSLDTVMMLVDKGADVNEIGWYGFDALRVAIIHCKPDIASFLLDYGANISPSHLLRCRTGVQMLFPNGPPEKGQSIRQAYPAFFISCMVGAESAVQLLLQYGLDVDACACEPFRSPLEAAVHHKRANVSELLLAAGADRSMVDSDKLQALVQEEFLIKETRSLVIEN